MCKGQTRNLLLFAWQDMNCRYRLSLPSAEELVILAETFGETENWEPHRTITEAIRDWPTCFLEAHVIDCAMICRGTTFIWFRQNFLWTIQVEDFLNNQRFFLTRTSSAVSWRQFYNQTWTAATKNKCKKISKYYLYKQRSFCLTEMSSFLWATYLEDDNDKHEKTASYQ